jgi:hypothetical protein
VLIVRVYNGKGTFGVILKEDEEKEAHRIFDRLVNEPHEEGSVVELLDKNLSTLKSKAVNNKNKEASL